ncbi:MAG: hypothetical protein WCL50_08595, partial [Spirochaetota bacterium]
MEEHALGNTKDVSNESRGSKIDGRPTSVYGIYVDVSEGDGKVPNSVEHARVESISPEVACPSTTFFVEGSGEMAQQPAHDRREALSLTRSHE